MNAANVMNAMKGTVLVVDDQACARRALATELAQAGFGVTEAEDGDQGWERFRESTPDVVVTDLRMPHCDGRALLERIRGASDVPVIFFCADASMSDAVEALKAGANDFVSSIEIRIGDLVRLVGAALSSRIARPESSAVEAAIGARMVGSSASMRRVRSRLVGLAPLDSPVLILGERGTGRDTAARTLHELGSSGAGSFRRVDCARFDVRQGVAKCSALYLDEVEALTPAMQAFWAEKLVEFERRGFRGVPRVLASATPRLAHASASAGDEQLRRVLTRFSVTLPPLRDRSRDVPEIADALVARLSAAMGRETQLTACAHEFLGGHTWHGNIRQLERLLERAVAFSGGGRIGRAALVELVGDYEESVESIRSGFEERERLELITALKEHGGNISLTSQGLGKSRGAIYRLIEKHGISLRRQR